MQLDNRDGLFDPDNTMGALSGLLGGGRRVQWQVNDGAGNLVEQWTGWLRDIRQRDQQTGFDRVTLRAWEVISLLVNDDKTVGQQTDIATGDAGQLLFDDVEDAAFYDPAYINGDRVMGRWWSDGPRWKALQDLEQTEAGFINVRKDGFIALDAASNRQSASSRVSQATFTDADAGALARFPPSPTVLSLTIPARTWRTSSPRTSSRTAWAISRCYGASTISPYPRVPTSQSLPPTQMKPAPEHTSALTPGHRWQQAPTTPRRRA